MSMAGDLRDFPADEIVGHNDELVADHEEKDCPWDDDSYTGGPGWAGDSDVSYGDYTASVPYKCRCECHERKGGVHAW
jgi:hypothetical protein